MQLSSNNGERGNAVVEFIAFGVVLFAPIATFAASITAVSIEKQIVSSAAPQLARAFAQGSSSFVELSNRYKARYPAIQIEPKTTACCVQVKVQLGDTREQASQVL